MYVFFAVFGDGFSVQGRVFRCLCVGHLHEHFFSPGVFKSEGAYLKCLNDVFFEVEGVKCAEGGGTLQLEVYHNVSFLGFLQVF